MNFYLPNTSLGGHDNTENDTNPVLINHFQISEREFSSIQGQGGYPNEWDRSGKNNSYSEAVGKLEEKRDNKDNDVQVVERNSTQTNNSNLDNIYLCRICCKVYKNIYNLSSHINKYHRNKTEPDRGDDTVYKFKCRFCDVSCESMQLLKEHENEHLVEKRFKCHHCNKFFSNHNYFLQHLKIHTEGSSHNCDLCHKSFANSSNYKIHLRYHDGNKPYRCEECEKSFLTSTNLTIHMRTHSGIRPFKCNHCDKTFINTSNLNIHMKYHNGVKTFQCHICDKYFLTSSNLKVHSRTHTGERPYTCFICNKSFVTSSNLNLHIKTHELKKKNDTAVMPT